MESTNRVTEPALDAFDSEVRGAVLKPGDEGYDQTRTVWNGVIDREPAAIARCAGAADVMAGVDFAREHDIPLSVKCGGHMTTGHAICDDGLVLDLSAMDGVRVDPRRETVRVQGGATWEQVNHEALPFGLVPPGIPDDVGVGGFTLGGGLGVVRRKYGLASDNLREVDVVTADGDLVHASAKHNPDLFWGLRGGGGNFGVVTSFEFDCFDEGRDCLTAQLRYPIDAAEEFLRFYREAMTDLPDALYPIVSFVTLPDLPSVPDEYVGEPGVSLYVMCFGDQDSLRGPLRELIRFGDPVMEQTEVKDYTELFEQWQVPKGERHRWKSVYLDGIPDELIGTLVEEVPPLPTADSAVAVLALGGAVSRDDADATAYAHRDASYLIAITAQWVDPAADEALVAWTSRLHEAVAEYGTGGEYVNNQTDDDPDRVRAGYGDHYDRLVDIKKEWDPGNLFRMNQNVEPTVNKADQEDGGG